MTKLFQRNIVFCDFTRRQIVMNSSEKRKLALVLLINRRKKRKIKFQKGFWVHPLNILRPQLGEELKVEEMYLKYPDKFFEYTRLSALQFDLLLDYVTKDITKMDTNYRKAISPRVRLFVTLKFLATGDSFKSLATSYSMGSTTVYDIINETTVSIWNNLAPIYVKPPTNEEWEIIMEEFEDLWNFPNCLGAIDGKHIQIQAPQNSGSTFYNYKGFFSLVLLATCDANYKFTTVDIGAYGRQSDGGVFARSALGKSLNEGTFPFPKARNIANSPYNHPCVFLGDEAFSLTSYMMRPYPGKFLENSKRIFNYRLSRGRRVIENAFGILSSRFRVFRRSLLSQPPNAVNIVKATISLHNFLRVEELKLDISRRFYCPTGYADENDEPNGRWRNVAERNALIRLSNLGSNMHSKLAKAMRLNLTDYFMGNGQVHWQYERAGIVNE